MVSERRKSSNNTLWYKFSLTLSEVKFPYSKAKTGRTAPWKGCKF